MPLNATLTLDSATGRLRSCTSITLIQDNLLENPETFNVIGTAILLTDAGVMSTVTLGPREVILSESTGQAHYIYNIYSLL